jgi:hypothetical protein
MWCDGNANRITGSMIFLKLYVPIYTLHTLWPHFLNTCAIAAERTPLFGLTTQKPEQPTILCFLYRILLATG